MGTQAEEAQCEKTTFPAEMVHSNQGSLSAPQFYQVSSVVYVATSCFLSAAFLTVELEGAYLGKRPVTITFAHFLENAFHLAM